MPTRMMKRFCPGAGLLLLFCAVAMRAPAVLAYPNDPNGFRGLAWQTAREQMGELRIAERHGAYVEYIKDADDLNFMGQPATRIRYGFTDDALETVTVQFEPPDDARYAVLRARLLDRYGPAELVGERDLFWRGGVTNIKLSVYGNGLEIIFSDNQTFSARLQSMDEFIAEFNQRWQELLREYDAQTAADKIAYWLGGPEGKAVLDSYHVSPEGAQISLNFKGGGTYMFSPSPSNTQQAVESPDVYSVGEVLEILRTDPERFRGKDILLRAVVVNAVMGLGCEDYLLLTDRQYADLYGRKHKRDVTAEERAAIEKIPLIISGPSLSMPKGIFAMGGEATFRGHFFDDSMKSCPDGAQRFVITDKE